MRKSIEILKEGDTILVEGIEGECTFGTILNKSDERWGARLKCIVTTPSEGIQEILCNRITNVLNIDDGYDQHLVFDNECYWVFNK